MPYLSAVIVNVENIENATMNVATPIMRKYLY